MITASKSEKTKSRGNLNSPRYMEIWLADLPLDSESDIIGGLRPVTVTSNNFFNINSNLVSVIPLTSRRKRMDLRTHVLIHDENLKTCSVALCEQILTLEKTKLKQRIGRISEREQDAIRRALSIQLSIFSSDGK